MISVCILTILLIACSYTSEPINTTFPTENTQPTESTPQFIIESVPTEPIMILPTETIPLEIESIETEPIIEETKPIPNDDEIVKIIDYIPNIVIDLKYATTDNFTGKVIYDFTDAYLRYGTIRKLMNVQDKLNELGYTLVIWDAYRPVEAQWTLWNVYPDSTYVANPNTGYSSHNRGNTIDITIQKLDGESVEMPTGFDEFSKKANRDYSDVSKNARSNALLLENIMIECGFKPLKTEWWHYSDTIKYPVVNK
jgi:D-alanyl-D-alanine dipeptidase